MTLTRRRLLTGTSAIVGAAGFGISIGATPAHAVEEAKLMADTGLPELSVGPKDAKVTIVEYASMTCPHCSRFHNEIYPKIKEKYVDTGKARIVFREFPLDNLAAAASMLARCAGEGKELAMVDVLFSKMDEWAYVRDKPVPALFELAKQAGFTKEKFETCLKDQALLDKLLAQKQRAVKEFSVSSTPSFFINGKPFKQSQTIENFSKEIDALLAGG
ncbi:MAG: DsbA family protein [Alphaproteobacteria bacterium]|nr:DsbA family protein [Alphaproteobacteria bacterium]